MLSAIVVRHTNSVLLDRIIAIDLKRFETPEFQHLLQRAMNSMGQLMGVTGAAHVLIRVHASLDCVLVAPYRHPAACVHLARPASQPA